MKKIFFILLLLILPNLTKAEIGGEYSVNNIKVNEIDKDATTARKNAMNKGQRDAFNIILERLGIDPSNGIIVSDDEISQTIRSMQIKNEKITINSYSATMSFEFSPDYVKYVLNKYNINKFSQRLDSYLIIPLMDENGKEYLWDKSNKWFAYFKKNLKGINNIFIVNNNFSSQLQVEEDYFIKPNFSKFKNIANAYGVNNVVAVYSKYIKGSDVIDIKIYVMDLEKTKAATLKYEIENQQSINTSYDKASIAIIDYIKTLFQKNAESNELQRYDNTTENEINIYMPISSLGDFHRANNVLKNNRNVVESKLKTLSKKLAIFSIKYSNNSLESFIQSLKNSGFNVSEKKEGIYIFI